MKNSTLFNEPKSPSYCPYCGKRGIHLRTDEVEITIRGIHFKYTEIVAECFSCKEEIYVPYINDYNCDSREHAYVTAKNRKENSDGRTD